MSVTVTGGQTNVGEGYIATSSELTGDKAGNYKLADEKTTTFSISKAAAPTLADITKLLLYTKTSVSASVTGAMPENAGTLTYTAGTAAKTGSVTVSDFAVAADGRVTATLSGGAVGDTVTLPVTIRSTNYADSVVSVVVTLTDMTDAGVTISEGTAITVTYGDSPTFSATASDPGSGGEWTWTSSDETIATVTSGAETTTVTIKKVTTVPIRITAAYKSGTTTGGATLQMTVGKKSVIITGLSIENKVYDGTTTATVTGTAAIGGQGRQ